ncbi:hypothetical protein HMPREF9176_1125 [Streptococcus downei F0415]|nr:hypothetical protein HMPREF9176_1125 [Streptococcus downei F0415]
MSKESRPNFKDWRELMEVAEIRQKIVENQEKLTSFRRSL